MSLGVTKKELDMGKKELELLYNEGPTKQKTRLSIVEAGIQLFSEYGIDMVSMKDIGVESQITTRNLYRYYPSKEYLVVDSAYHLFHTLGPDLESSEMTDGSGIELVERMIRLLFRLEKSDLAGLQFVRFIMYFDLFLYKMDENHPAYIKYTEIYVPNMNDESKKVMCKFIRKGFEDGSITNKGIDVEVFSEYILQSFMGLTMRTMLKEKENKAINEELIEVHIETVKNYLLQGSTR